MVVESISRIILFSYDINTLEFKKLKKKKGSY